jgi:hypothetical protein
MMKTNLPISYIIAVFDFSELEGLSFCKQQFRAWNQVTE